MTIVRRSTRLLAALLLTFSVPDADANPSRDALAATRLGGLHLGMTQADFDAMVRSNPTWNELYTGGDLTDCTDLELGDRDNRGPPYFLKSLAATDREGRRYSVEFALNGSRMVADRISYAIRLPSAPWESLLAQAQQRFGKADWVGLDGSQHQALWCSPGDVECTKGNHEYSSGPNLALTFYPNEEAELEAGDRLDYELSRGNDAEDAADNAWNAALDNASPRKRAALLARCRTAPGGFKSRDAIARHYASLVPLGRSASPAIFSPHAVPPGVFAAIGIDAARTFSKGVCFNSMDFFIQDDQERCPGGQVGIGFRWARKVKDTWLLSMLFGGAGLKRPYFAVREIAPGRYRKVWWAGGFLPSEGVASFNAWRAEGAVPMTEPPRQQ